MKKNLLIPVLFCLCTLLPAQVIVPGSETQSERPAENLKPDSLRQPVDFSPNGLDEGQSPSAQPAATKKSSTQSGATVDRIIAVIGSQIVKQSDFEQAMQQFRNEGYKDSDSLRGAVMEQLMLKRLLVQAAQHDSVEVSEAEIDAETDRRMRYFLMQFKSDKEFEDFYGKTVEAFKFELHDQVRELLLAQRMQQRIGQNVNVSPADINSWFNAQQPDSLPLINSEVEIGQIVIVPPPNPEIKEYVKQNLSDIRRRILNGSLKFEDAVRAYSKDPGSIANGGCYENVRRGTFVPEFDAVAFNMKEGEISEPFETSFGFHIVKLVARRGEEVTICHILLDIPSSPDDLRTCKNKLDSVLTLIRLDSMSFCEAATRFSTDDESKYNCGLILNPATGTSRIDVELLGDIDPDPQFPITVNGMKVGQMISAQPCLTRTGKQGYRILYLKSRSEPHRANLKDDYQLIQDMALQAAQDAALDAWVKKRLVTTYVRINQDFRGYAYHYPWMLYIK